MADPWKFWSPAAIALATQCPEDAVEANWPLIADALERRGIYDRDVCLGVLGTVAIETASTFRPIHEYGTPADWERYEGGSNFAGRGLIQITHKSNYRAAGAGLGLDLVSNPDLALDPKNAAEILAWYWSTRGVKARDGSRWYSLPDLCHEHDWEWVRRVVQGGTDGLDRLVTIATALDANRETTAMPKVTFNPQEPAHTQEHDYDCSQDSLEWAMWSVGRKPTDGWMESQMIADGIMSKDLGLLDASGKALAKWITDQYSEFGYYANNEPTVSFQALAEEIGPYPMLIGGRNWGGPGKGHWSGLKGYDKARDVLLLANPGGTGPTYGGQEMTRAQFSQRGPFSMVRVLHPDLLEPTAPTPAPPAPKPDDRLARVRAKLEETIAIIDGAV